MRKSRRFFDLKETLCFVRKSIRICNKKLAEKEKKKYTTKVSKIKKGKKKIRKTLKLYSRYKKNNWTIEHPPPQPCYSFLCIIYIFI